MRNLINIINDDEYFNIYIRNEKDVDLISSVIAYINKSEDSFWDDSAETLLKSLIYYLLSKDKEIKSLKRCKEIVELELDESCAREKINNIRQVKMDRTLNK